jgi:hypothetical protein
MYSSGLGSLCSVVCLTKESRKPIWEIVVGPTYFHAAAFALMISVSQHQHMASLGSVTR